MDELELLTALVEMYEDQHYPIGPPDPIEAINSGWTSWDCPRKKMVPYIGSKSKVSEVLNGKRPLTLAMMRSLNQNLGISAEVLLQEPGAGFRKRCRVWNGINFQWLKWPGAAGCQG